MAHFVPRMTRHPGDPEPDPEQMRAIWEEGDRNTRYLVEHEQEFYELYPEKWVLIHSGGTVEAFDDLRVLEQRRRELPPISNAASDTWVARPAGVAFIL